MSSWEERRMKKESDLRALLSEQQHLLCSLSHFSKDYDDDDDDNRRG